MNADKYLRKKAFEGLNKKGYGDNPQYIERLEEELQIIKNCGVSDFILNTAYTVLFLKNNGIIVGPGRGSIGGSLVAWVIGITEIDSIKYGLSFARFLNESRMKTSMPDVDIDVSKKDRPKVLRLLKKEFGEDRTCQIINDVYFTDKTILKDLCRIFNIDFQVSNRLTSLIGDGTIYDSEDVMNFLHDNPKIEKAFPKIQGLIRNSSTHAGGVLISDKPIDEYISTLKTGDNIVTCYNGRVCEENGFLKQDMLGLNTLSIIKDCLSFIGKNKFDFDYDLDDPNVYTTINNSTLGIFQLEGKGASEYTIRLKPQCFNDIVADLALVRPGAQDSGDSEEFLEVRFGYKDIEYDHPLLEDILKETNGCILYQEQAMQISRVLSGFTDVEADTLRKGIGKKLDYIFDEYKPKFIQGAMNNGVDKDIAERIWSKIEKASSYSFNKSHSVGYSLITYQTAYLKTYYPIEFYTAMLNNVENEDKRIRIYNEIKLLNKNILNPDINKSKEITIYDDKDNIYLSFNLIKGVGPAAIKDILKNQPYISFEDFMERKTSKVNKSVVKALIEAGAFDCFNNNRSKLYNVIEETHSWTPQETLFREFQRIKINPTSNILELYDLEDMGINVQCDSIKTLKCNTDDYKDFFIKVLPSEFDNKDNYAFTGVTDGFDSISIFVSKEFLSRYIDDLKIIGLPLLCHVHGKGEKYSLMSLINLQEPMKYKHEYWWYTGESFKKLKALQEANPFINCCIASNVSYFTSKNGNPCVRYNANIDGETLEGRIKVYPPLMVEGSFIFFEVQNNPVFLEIIQVS